MDPAITVAVNAERKRRVDALMEMVDKTKAAAVNAERKRCVDALMEMADKTKADAQSSKEWPDLYRSLGERWRIIIECVKAVDPTVGGTDHVS